MRNSNNYNVAKLLLSCLLNFILNSGRRRFRFRRGLWSFDARRASPRGEPRFVARFFQNVFADDLERTPVVFEAFDGRFGLGGGRDAAAFARILLRARGFKNIYFG